MWRYSATFHSQQISIFLFLTTCTSLTTSSSLHCTFLLHFLHNLLTLTAYIPQHLLFKSLRIAFFIFFLILLPFQLCNPLFLILLLRLLLSPSLAVPPAPPVHCNLTGGGCVVSNANGAWGDRRECLVSSVAYPSTEEELCATIADARRRNFKVKVVSGFSHTIPKLVCPPPDGSLLISTAKYNSGVAVDAARRTVTADAGVGLRDLIKVVEAAGFSLPAAPYWEGVSIAGLISTGSHGRKMEAARVWENEGGRSRLCRGRGAGKSEKAKLKTRNTVFPNPRGGKEHRLLRLVI